MNECPLLQIPAPFKPVVASELCTANFDEVYTKRPALDSPGGTPDVGVTNPFMGYTYSRDSMLLNLPQDSAHASGQTQ